MYCARVSNPKNQDSDNTRLINYCIKHGHWSIFEMANMVVEIETSRAISAQILRHRSFCFQEFSQRYAKVNGFKTYPARRQDDKNRQNSIDDFSKDEKDYFDKLQDQVHIIAQDNYEKALALGVAKEQARFLLPMSATSRLYMNGNVRSWIHYLKLRTANGTQKEHQEIAEKIRQIFVQQFPNISEALEWK